MSKKALVIITVIILIIVIPTGLFITRMNMYGISEIYYKEFTLTEDIVFDDPQVIELIGEPVTLEAGTQGVIVDAIDYGGDTRGYEYISAHYSIGGKGLCSVVISIDPEAETRAHVITDSNVTDILLIINISKIESGQTIIPEYLQTRENYHTRVRNEWIKGTAITVTVAAALVAATCLTYKRRNKRTTSQDEL